LEIIVKSYYADIYRKFLDSDLFDEEGYLKESVRDTLLSEAYKFIEWVPIPLDPVNIYFVGSETGFMYDEYSDIDIHIVVDFSKIESTYSRTFDEVRKEFDSYQKVYNENKELRTVFGHPIEFYIQDVDEIVESPGVYDLVGGSWVKFPEKPEIDVEDVVASHELAKTWAKKIDNFDFNIKDKIYELEVVRDLLQDSPDDKELLSQQEALISEISDLRSKVDSFKEDLRAERKKAINSEGVTSKENMAFKLLRRYGYLTRLSDISNLVNNVLVY